MKGRAEHRAKSEAQMRKALAGRPDFIVGFYNELYLSKEYTTAQAYTKIILRYFSSCASSTVEDFNYENISQFFLSLRGKNGDECSDSAYATNRAALYSFGEYLLRQKLITENPVGRTSPRKVKDYTCKDYLLTEELHDLLVQIKNNSLGSEREQARRKPWVERNLAIISLMVATGIRVTALSELNISDYNGSELVVLDKGRKQFEYELDEMTCKILNDWINKRKDILKGKECEALFISNRLTRITTKSLRDLVKSYTEHLGKNISPHRLRSSYAIKLYKETGDIFLVQQCLKHSDIRTTIRYMSDFSIGNKEAAKIATRGLY